jgi:hypothetical protein
MLPKESCVSCYHAEYHISPLASGIRRQISNIFDIGFFRFLLSEFSLILSARLVFILVLVNFGSLLILSALRHWVVFISILSAH